MTRQDVFRAGTSSSKQLEPNLNSLFGKINYSCNDVIFGWGRRNDLDDNREVSCLFPFEAGHEDSFFDLDFTVKSHFCMTFW